MKKSKILIPTPSEYAEQVAVFRLRQLYVRQHPLLRFLYGSLSGVRLTPGNANKCKNAGCLVSGIPDIALPVRSRDHSGLYIELKKREGGHIDPDQIVWREFLLSQGFDHHFCYGSDETWDKIMEHLENV